MKEKSVSLPQRLVAEALGTAFLLAAVVGSGIMAQRLAGGNDALALLCNTLPTGAILAVLILIFGPLSGAHFNPARSVIGVRACAAWSCAREIGYIVIGNLLLSVVLYMSCRTSWRKSSAGVIGVWTAHLMFELPVLRR